MTRIDHLEDLIFEGRDGIFNALHILREFLSEFTDGRSSLHITSKWDGAPAIVCGQHPETGYFFVSTKAAFNKTPKICYTYEDVVKNYNNPILWSKLGTCLHFLPHLKIKGIMQGDMMYTSEDLKFKGNYITFKPNIVEYKIPLNTNLGKHICNSQLGIVFHTQYHGNLMESLQPNYRVDIGSLTPSNSVWYRDAFLVNMVGESHFFTQPEFEKYKNILKEIKGYLQKCNMGIINTFIVNETIKNLTKRYINDNVRKRNNFFGAPSFNNFIINKLGEEIEAAKKPETKENRTKKLEEIKTVSQHDTIEKLFAIYNLVIEAKNIIISKLDKMKDIETVNDIREGYVVSKTQFAIKLVDRTTFSYLNFQEND